MSGIVGTSHSKSKVIGRSKDTAKVWVSFNQSGTDAINSDYGVSTVGDGGSGSTTINFDSAFSDTNYATVLGGQYDAGGFCRHLTPGTGSIVVESRANNTFLSNSSPINVAIFA